jgi:heterodisulfide reductase subunit B
MSLALYPGCVIRTVHPEVEKAVKETLSRLGVSFQEKTEASCCAPSWFFSLSREAWLRLNERNMRIFKSTVVTACDDCFASLSDAFRVLASRNGVKPPEVKPFQALLLERLREVKPRLGFTGLRCAVQHSCRFLRPSGRGLDNPEDPKIVKSVLEMLGFLPVSYERELDCCGGFLSDENIGREMARVKAGSAEKAGADCIVATCSHCMLRLSPVSNIPVLHLAQLSAFSLGLDPVQAGFPEALLRRMVKR